MYGQTSSLRASQCPGPGPPQARGTAQSAWFSSAPCPGRASLPLPQPEGAPAVLPRAAAQKHKAARPPKCECRRSEGRGRARGSSSAGACLSARVPAQLRPGHRGCRKEDADVERAARPSLGPESGGGGALPALGFPPALFSGPSNQSRPRASTSCTCGPRPRPQALQLAVVPDRVDEKARAPRVEGLPGLSLPGGAPRGQAHVPVPRSPGLIGMSPPRPPHLTMQSHPSANPSPSQDPCPAGCGCVGGGPKDEQGLGPCVGFFFFNHNGCVPHHVIFVTYISPSYFVKTPPRSPPHHPRLI